MAEMKTWDDMRTRIRAQLERQTGHGVEEWNERIRSAGASDEDALRRWLDAQGVSGYPQMLLVWETLGYPDFLLASADELVEAQYADRVDLRPICDALLTLAAGLDGVSIQARKTYVAILSPRRTFAVVQATTKRRVDLGLRLAGVEPGGRLASGKSVGNDAVTIRIPLERLEDVDDEVERWLRAAYDESR
jgi:hypothetical protein